MLKNITVLVLVLLYLKVKKVSKLSYSQFVKVMKNIIRKSVKSLARKSMTKQKKFRAK